MKNLTVQEILEQTNGKLIIGNKELECKTFSNDTRKLQKGDTYIGIKGETFNGNNFWKQAFEKGADCVIVEGIEFSENDKKEFEGKTIDENSIFFKIQKLVFLPIIICQSMVI